jgi:cytochrome c peroxidase
MKSRVLVVGVFAAIILTALAFHLAFRAGGVQVEIARGSDNQPAGVGQVSNLPAIGQVGNLPHAVPAKDEASYDWQLPDPRWQQQAVRHERPIYFVNRAQMPVEWDRLPTFWNEVAEQVADPVTGIVVERKAVKIKVPLGLQHNPPVPAENPMTVAKWELGKKLYFDPILSSDGTVSCASCHDPRRGYTDQAAVSTGIKGLKGGISAPTVLNTAYSPLLFWDGRADSLEHQAQGPPQNVKEMFDGAGDAWRLLVERVRRKDDYRKRFLKAFGTEPTRDVIAKAIACYERTVLSGNSIHDRAERAGRLRGQSGAEARDYETALREAMANSDLPALTALNLKAKDSADTLARVAGQVHNGRVLFFGKARCNLCHSGDNFTDNQFHNLGVGVKDGRLPPDGLGRFASLPTGHKNVALMGSFKTPTLRGLLDTGPYMHDGSEASLEDVIEFYNRGGIANPFLDTLINSGTPTLTRRLRLTSKEKANLVLFLRALQGDPVDPIITDPN